MTFPSVDLSVFLSGDAEKKNKFVQSLGKAYEEIGFVAIKNHDISDDLIINLYKYVQHNTPGCKSCKTILAYVTFFYSIFSTSYNIHEFMLS